jgi:hypothetical protein
VIIFNELARAFRNAANNFAEWNICPIWRKREIPHRGTLFSRVKNAAPSRADRRGRKQENGDAKRRNKKKPAGRGLESIFLEEDRGDRNHDAASHHNRPMIVRDSGYPPGA